MTLLKRATIKSYDAGTHRATVGISGSLSVWLAGLAVSDGIAAASVVVGRECAVLFHTEDNPDDAVVISVHGGGPPAGGGDVSGPGSSADNALARFNGAGGKTVQNSGSTLDDSGNLSLQKNLGVRTAAPTGDARIIDCSPTLSVTASVEALAVSPIIDINASAGISVFAVRGTLTGKVSGGGSYNFVAGLDYVAAPWSDGTGTQTVASLIGAQAGVQTIRTLGTLNVTEAIAFNAYGFQSALGLSTTITDLIGVNIQGPYGTVVGGITNATGLRIEHIAYGTNKYLIHAFRDASKNTSLRLDAGAPPDAALATEGDSNLYLAWMENGAVNVRPVRWRWQSSLAATDKVLIAA
jgi:hypothetical protein